jgi:DnaJ family protein C protein 3
MYQQSIDDVAYVLKSSPSNEEKRQCYQIRANVYLQTGELKKASDDAIASGQRQLIDRIDEVKRATVKLADATKKGDVATQERLLDQIIKAAPRATQYVLQRADIAWEKGEQERYFELTNGIAEDLPKDKVLHYRRGLVAFCHGEVDTAEQDLRKASRIRGAGKNASVLLKALESMKKSTQDATRALSHAKLQDAEAAINRSVAIAKGYCPEDSDLFEPLIILNARLLRLKGLSDEAMELLDREGARHPDRSADFYIEQGDLHLERDDYAAAHFDYQNALSRDPGNQRAREGLNRASELQKKSEHVDYYGVLGVNQDATIEQIKAAYNKLVRKWHPDLHHDPAKKQEAEEMMKKINTALEILGDPNRRESYDRGEDPGEPGGQGGGASDIHEFMQDVFQAFFGGGGGGDGQGQGQGQGARFQRVEFVHGHGGAFQFQFPF